MNAANRKTKLSRYEVVVTRTLEWIDTIDIEARSIEEAQERALGTIAWGGHKERILYQRARAKVLR